MIAEYENLTRDTRMRLVGHYLSKMVTLMHAAELEQMEIKARLAANGGVLVANDTSPANPSPASECIVKYLKKVGSASAREINRYGGVARSSMFRHLWDLTEAGIIGKIGTRKQTRYRLVNTGKTFLDRNRQHIADSDCLPQKELSHQDSDYCI